jgi:dTDP-4-dehydrorhamnose reductase
VDLCERDPSLAWRVNAELPAKIASACRDLDVNLLHISTDAVFDGKSLGPYSETDAPHPIGVYAQTKLAAEAAVLDAHARAIVARVNFYGWSITGSRSLAEFFVNNLGAGIPVRGFADVTFCPMLVNDLAMVIFKMLARGLHGLFHATGPEPMTKYEFGVSIARQFGFDERLISAESVDKAGLPAQRAHRLHLSVHKLSTALGELLPSFSTGLAAFHAQYGQGYPQRIRAYQQAAPVASDKSPARSSRRESASQ